MDGEENIARTDSTCRIVEEDRAWTWLGINAARKRTCITSVSDVDREYKLDVSRVPLDGIEAVVDAWLTVIRWLIREFTRRTRRSRGYFIVCKRGKCIVLVVGFGFVRNELHRSALNLRSIVFPAIYRGKKERKEEKLQLRIGTNNNDLDVLR